MNTRFLDFVHDSGHLNTETSNSRNVVFLSEYEAMEKSRKGVILIVLISLSELFRNES
jgi:hypothetical protein